MSVNSCDRRGCDNIMCDRLILHRTMYICRECYEELCEAKVRHWPDELQEKIVEEKIRDFMRTPKGTYSTPDSTDEAFRRLTGG